jgi:hypothetical protein
VVAGQERIRVVVDGEPGIIEPGVGHLGGQEHSLEPGGGGVGGCDHPLGRRPGDPFAVVDAFVKVVEVVGHGAGGLEVQYPAQSVACAAAVAFGHGGGAQVAVLEGERDAPAREAGDVPGDRAASVRTRRVQKICVAILPGLSRRLTRFAGRGKAAARRR